MMMSVRSEGDIQEKNTKVVQQQAWTGREGIELERIEWGQHDVH